MPRPALARPAPTSTGSLWFVAAPHRARVHAGLGAHAAERRRASTGVLGWLESLVRAQPVPVGIVLFTLFEIALWAARHQLPLSQATRTRRSGPTCRSTCAARSSARARCSTRPTIILGEQREGRRARAHRQGARALCAATSTRCARRWSACRSTRRASSTRSSKADGEVDVRLGRWRKSEVREYVEAILMAVAVAFALRAFVIEAFKIPSGSMIPTLMVGDHIFVNKFSYGPAIPYTHSRVWTQHAAAARRRHGLRVPRAPGAGLHQARHRASRATSSRRKNGHPVINGWEVPSCTVGTWSYNDYDSPIARHEGELYVEYLGDESYLTFYDRASGAFPRVPGARTSPSRARSGSWATTATTATTRACGSAGRAGRPVREHPRPRALRLAQRERQRDRLVARGRARHGAAAAAAVGEGPRAAAREVPEEPPVRDESAVYPCAIGARWPHAREEGAAMPTYVLMTKLSPTSLKDPRGRRRAGQEWKAMVDEARPGHPVEGALRAAGALRLHERVRGTGRRRCDARVSPVARARRGVGRELAGDGVRELPAAGRTGGEGMSRLGAAVAVAIAAIAGSAACGAAEKAAAKDPMRCERDPSCAKARGAYPDCARQCSDDPECMDRCRQVQQGTDALGHQHVEALPANVHHNQRRHPRCVPPPSSSSQLGESFRLQSLARRPTSRARCRATEAARVRAASSRRRRTGRAAVRRARACRARRPPRASGSSRDSSTPSSIGSSPWAARCRRRRRPSRPTGPGPSTTCLRGALLRPDCGRLRPDSRGRDPHRSAVGAGHGRALGGDGAAGPGRRLGALRPLAAGHGRLVRPRLGVGPRLLAVRRLRAAEQRGDRRDRRGRHIDAHAVDDDRQYRKLYYVAFATPPAAQAWYTITASGPAFARCPRPGRWCPRPPSFMSIDPVAREQRHGERQPDAHGVVARAAYRRLRDCRSPSQVTDGGVTPVGANPPPELAPDTTSQTLIADGPRFVRVGRLLRDGPCPTTASGCVLSSAAPPRKSRRSEAAAHQASRKCTAFGRVSASKPSALRLTPRPESFQPVHGSAGSR